MKRNTNQFARVGGMQSRRFHLLIAVFCLVVAGLMPETVTANSPPTVSNVTAYQRTDGVVVISYVLRDADYDPCMITVQVSDDGGQSWAIIPSPEALSGDLVNVLPNYQTSPSGGVQIYSQKPTIFPSKRTIYWNSRVDLPGVYGENYRIRIIADDRVEQRMVFIPGGTFQMGDSFSEGNSNERPIHTVTLSPYYMSQYEVTNGAYCQFLNSMYNPDVSPEHSPIFLIEGVVYGGRHIRPPDAREYYYPFCDTTVSNPNSLIEFSNGTFSVCNKNGRNMSNDPMVFVSWYGAAAFCDWQSQQDGRESCYGLMLLFTDYTKDGYRLPTEAEWEYAARGGLSGKRFPWGDTITHEQANYYSTSSCSYDISPTRGHHPVWNDGILPYTSSVGRFTPNGYALYDMAGNVFEWCNDWYGLYDSLPQNDPRGPASGTGRILRGGGWGFDAYNCRAGFRGVFSPSERYDFLGFRLARNYAGEITTVPNLFMMSRANAQAAIAAAGLVVGTVTEDTSPVVPKGCVMGQNLAVGSNVPMASVVNIVVSQGPPIGGIIYYLVRVPDVIGKTQSEAREAIEAARLVVGTVTQEYSETVSQGRVISQNPSGGSYSTEGSTVDLVVSKGRPATVPNVVGMYYLDAYAAIDAAGLVLGQVTTENHPTIPYGYVISQNPAAGTKVPPGSAVNGVVSIGPVLVSVPDVTGMTQANAQAAIVAAGLVVGTVTEAYSNTVPPGNVISQDPLGGTQVSKGSTVNLTISKGVTAGPVPNLIGMTQEYAQFQIVMKGFVVGTISQEYSETVESGHVISQNPAPGILYLHGSPINLVVSKGPSATVPNVVGMHISDAFASINAASLVVGTITQQRHPFIPYGHVISQNPVGGTIVPRGSAVNGVISMGP